MEVIHKDGTQSLKVTTTISLKKMTQLTFLLDITKLKYKWAFRTQLTQNLSSKLQITISKLSLHKMLLK